jgi:hypothetical protein
MKREQLIDLLAKRLTYIWHIRDTNPERFHQEKLGYEKQDIYAARGPDQDLYVLSHKYYYDTHGKAYEAILSEADRYRYDEYNDTMIKLR